MATNPAVIPSLNSTNIKTQECLCSFASINIVVELCIKVVYSLTAIGHTDDTCIYKHIVIFKGKIMYPSNNEDKVDNCCAANNPSYNQHNREDFDG